MNDRVDATERLHARPEQPPRIARDIGVNGHGSPARRTNSLDAALRSTAIGPVIDSDPPTVRREPLGDCAADAAAGARDDRHLGRIAHRCSVSDTAAGTGTRTFARPRRTGTPPSLIPSISSTTTRVAGDTWAT